MLTKKLIIKSNLFEMNKETKIHNFELFSKSFNLMMKSLYSSFSLNFKCLNKTMTEILATKEVPFLKEIELILYTINAFKKLKNCKNVCSIKFDELHNDKFGSIYSEMNEIKYHYLLKKLERLKYEKSKNYIKIVELCSNGMNFDFFPEDSALTLCNTINELESQLFTKLNKNKRRLWLLNKNINFNLNDLKSNSADYVISTHYLCGVNNVSNILDEIYRVLKPGGSFIYVEHIQNNNSYLIRLAQFLLNPIWTYFNSGCSLTNLSLKRLETNKFPIVDQFICSINCSNNWFLNSMQKTHVLGLAKK